MQINVKNVKCLNCDQYLIKSDGGGSIHLPLGTTISCRTCESSVTLGDDIKIYGNLVIE